MEGNVRWASLTKGMKLLPRTFRLRPAWVRQYTSAVEDGAIGQLGSDVAPMAIAALAFRSLLEAIELPPGALHAGQELSFLAPVQVGQSLTARAKVASSGQRAGWSLLTFDLQVQDEGGRTVLTGRTTATVPLSDVQQGLSG